MKLRIQNQAGIIMLQPSKVCHKPVAGQSEWQDVRESGSARRLFPREVKVRKGCHEVERVANPFIPGGEPWLVIKGSRTGAAEGYLRQLAEATRGTRHGVEVICE